MAKAKPNTTTQPICTWGQLCEALKSAPRDSYVFRYEWRDRAWRPERVTMRLVVAPDGGRYLPSISQARARAAGIDRAAPVTWTDDRVVIQLRRGRLSLLALTALPPSARHPRK